MARTRHLTCLLACLAVIGFAGIPTGPARAQTAPPDPALVADLVAGSRILADLGVVDAFGHISARSPSNPNHFLMSRNLAPGLVTADDIMEFDLDGNAIDPRGRAVFFERFIHGEIYRARPDVKSVVHSHSLGVIPFGISSVKLGATYLNTAFLAGGVPIFDIHDVAGDTNMLIGNSALGAALAKTLADKPVALLRGHGDVVVGPDIPTTVFRAYYTDVGARLQAQAIGLGGSIKFLTEEEGRKGDLVNAQILGRAWDLWKQKVSAR